MPVTTFYPQVDPETTSVDGRVLNEEGAVYATVQGAAAGTAAPSAEAGEVYALQNTKTPGLVFTVGRAFTLFDTSSLNNGDTVSAATYSIWFVTINNADTDSVSVITTSPASNTNLVTDDFDQAGTTKQATDVALSAITGNQYTDIALNSTGLTNVSLTGISKFGMRTAKDIAATQPTGVNNISQMFADTAGTANDPKLAVTHSLALETSVKSITSLLLGV